MSRGPEINTFGFMASSCYTVSLRISTPDVFQRMVTYGVNCNNNPYGVIISIIISLGQ
jgi:hypothetical protein